MTHDAPVLQARGLSLQYGPCAVVQEVDLDVAAGRWLSIVGPNGAGKSTLLRALAGLMPAASGSVALQGQPLPHWPARERAQTLAWLGQGGEFGEGLSVRDTVALGRLPHQGPLGLSGESADDAQAIASALQRTDLQEAGPRRVETLSGGERQRVLLARALAVQAPLLLLDEPSSHLDAPHLRLLARVLREHATQGRHGGQRAARPEPGAGGRRGAGAAPRPRVRPRCRA